MVVYLCDLGIVWFVLVVKDECCVLVDVVLCVICICDGGCSFEVLCEGLL